MSPLLALLGPVLGLGVAFYVWLYIVPLMLAYAGFHFVKAAFLALFRRDLPLKNRAALASHATGQAVLGFASSALVAVLIFHRSELYAWFAGLF